MAMVEFGTETAIVQQVSKASSDELLRKFADPDESDSKPSRTPKRRRIRRRNAEGETSDGFAERKSLLTQPTTASRPRSAVLRRLGITRSQITKARDVKNRSVLGSIQKTWSKAVRGASRVFIEKHYNSHKRLTSDIV